MAPSFLAHLPRKHALSLAIFRLERYLMEHRHVLFTKQHRDGGNKRQFSLKGSFKAGLGSAQVGNLQHVEKGRPHFKRHNFKKTAVYTQPVREQKTLKPYQKMAYYLASEVIKLIDPDFAAGEYLVNFSHMDSKRHYVKRHVDADDISYQYLLAFGDYVGTVALRVYDERGQSQMFDCRDRILKMDGRLPHEVVKSYDFEGDRFAVIFYKSYDARMAKADPVFREAGFVL